MRKSRFGFRLFKDVSIARKLRGIMMLTSGLSLLIATSGFVLWGRTTLKTALSTANQRTAQMTAGSCRHGLISQDASTVKDVLATLRAEPSVVYACVFGRSWEIIAEYRRDADFTDVVTPETFAESEWTASGRYMLATEDVIVNGDRKGTIYIQSDLALLNALAQESLQIVGAVLLVALLSAYALSSGLQKVVSTPLLRLAGTAKAITLKSDYTLRAKGNRGDEIGLLIRLFNEMLDQIQSRDRALSRRKEDLEAQVERRTAELSSTVVKLYEAVAQHRETEDALRESQERFWDVAMSSGDLIWEADQDWKYTFAAGKVQEIFGHDGQELIGRTCFDLMPPEEVCRMRKTFEDCARQRRAIVDVENWKRTCDGSRVCVLTNGVPRVNEAGEFVGYRGVDKDITERKGTETEAKRAREMAESASKAKSEFLATMSHEIRTPMNGVIGMLELLRDTKLTPKQLRYVDVAKSSAGTLLDIINDVLDFSKIEAGKFELDYQEFDLSAMGEEVIEMLGPQAEAHHNSMVCHVDPALPRQVVGDPTRFRQILINLVGNAVKFTEDGQVTLDIRQENIQADDVVIRVAVTDTGIGIPDHQLHRLFQLFSQADPSMNRKFTGTGLGLAISRHLAEMMGGEIGVESEPGRGSCFWFTARFARGQTAASYAEEDGYLGSTFTHLRVLGVTEDSDVLETPLRQLEAWGCSTTIVNSSPAALQTLRASLKEQTPFSIIFLDASKSPDLSLETAARIHASSELCGLPMILLAHSECQVNPTELQESGVSACLTTPVDSRRLYAAVTELLHLGSQDGPRPGTEPAPCTMRRNMRVLIAEDNEINMEFALEVLRKAGYQVDTAMDGRSALQAATRKSYDVILMDCQMPDMDGLEATRKIREKEEAEASIGGSRNKRVPIIALTANALKEDRKQCLDGGMTDYLSKPIAPAKLIEMVDRYAGCAEAKPTPPRVVAETQPCAAVSAAIPGTSKASPFDIEALLRRCNGSREFMTRILTKFKAKMPEILTELEQGIRAGEPEHVGLLAHTLKGMAGNLAAEPLRAAAFELEQLAKNGELGEAAVSLEKIQREYQRCEEDLPKTITLEQARDEGTDR